MVMSRDRAKPIHIVFHGANAGAFFDGFGPLLPDPARISQLPDILEGQEERELYISADVLIATAFDASLPVSPNLALFQVPGAGYDAVDFASLPASAAICNCFGHEQAIAEYVMSALLARHVPLADADRRLRGGDWSWWAGARERVHDEMAGKTIGLLGFGHIGKAIARRAKAFEMRVHVANRSPVPVSDLVDRAYALHELVAFCAGIDVLVTSLPLDEETRGKLGVRAFAAMRPHAVIINVGRGPVIDEAALFEALEQRRIGGAIIDTWYVYPSASDPDPQPSSLPFHELDNIVMTPHMSGWTGGTILRRQRTMAQNINRIGSTEAFINMVRPPKK